MSCEKTIFPAFIRHPQPTGDRGMGEKRKRVEIENGHDGVYPLHREELTSGCSANNRTVVSPIRMFRGRKVFRPSVSLSICLP
jgi:hypothetical protein